MQIISNGDKLHELSMPILLENWAKHINMSSAEIFTQYAKC